MERLAYSFVLAYHGCEKRVGLSLLRGRSFKPSENDYDWLGPGAYFWENNPLRGLEWAEEQKLQGRIADPWVIGAVIDLGNCLDLSTHAGVQLVRLAYDSLSKSGISKLPSNTPRGRRFLDCAVIRHLHAAAEDPRSGLRPFDTVRGLFTEGEPAFPGSSFLAKTHVQVAVRNLEMIKGIFRVPDRQLRVPAAL